MQAGVEQRGTTTARLPPPRDRATEQLSGEIEDMVLSAFGFTRASQQQQQQQSTRSVVRSTDLVPANNRPPSQTQQPPTTVSRQPPPDNVDVRAFCVFGSRPSDHYFRSVCLFVCLFVQSFSQPSSIRFRSN